MQTISTTQRIVVIAGPTASGKSALALTLAKRLNGEIVCADSRQVYAGMAVGTAAPTKQQRHCITHHGYTVRDPAKRYHVAQFVQDTDQFIQTILQRQKTAILVGGTGLYLRSWRFGIDPAPAADIQLRQQLQLQLQQQGAAALYEQLRRIDPDTASRIEPQDHVRLLRALEIYQLTGKPPSHIRPNWQQRPPRMQADWLLLWPAQEHLAEKIVKRAHQLFQAELIEEACRLRQQLSHGHALLQTMGYQEALLYHDGELSRQRALERVIVRHRQYAKRQKTWFRKEEWWRVIDSFPRSKKFF
ncbi:MAG: tRNA (adenosine(37)-N6)-dimethylallyltransferase MiaA [Myxococcota bacterium]